MEKIKKLERCYLFNGINKEFLQQISLKTTIVSFERNEFIFFEGDQGKYFYIVLDGKVEIYKSTSDDREIVLKTVTKDEIFAEVIVFQENIYPATAKAVSHTRLLQFDRETIISMLENSEFRMQFINTLFMKLRELGDRLKFLNSMDVEERFLFYLSTNYGRKENYEIHLSKKEFAREIGTIPETLSRMIKKLNKNGVKWKGQFITFPENFWETRSP